MKSAKRQKGFTLTELMVTIGVASVLLGIAVPAMVNFIRGARLAGSSRDIVTDLALARNEATLRNSAVTVCTSTDLTTCSNSSWTDGRLVFTDAGTVGAVDGGDVILSVTQPLDSALTATGTDIAAANFISYSPRGRLTTWGQIRLCADDQMRRIITVRRSGAATLERTVTPC